jgi:hypothetical protein
MSPGGSTRPQSAHERETTLLRVRAEAAEAGRDAAIADRSAGSLWRITGALLRDAMARAVRAEAGRVAERTRANALHDRFEAQLTTAEQAAGRAWRQAARMGWAPGPLVVLLHDVHCHVSQNGEVLRAVAQSVPVLVLIHHDVEPPMQVVSTPQCARTTSLKRSAELGACAPIERSGSKGGAAIRRLASRSDFQHAQKESPVADLERQKNRRA